MNRTIFTPEKRIWLKECPSTNSHAQRLLAEKIPEGTQIGTECQTAGRGQFGNQWEALPGQNLTVSLVLYPEKLPLDKLFFLSKMTSLAVFHAIQSFLPGTQIAIKWPNDILLEEKKVVGILIENQLEGAQLKSSIIGIGINVNQRFFSPEIKHKTISMVHCHHMPIPVEAVLESVLDQMEVYYKLLLNKGYLSLDQQYHQQLFGLNQTKTFLIDGAELKGIIRSVPDNGFLNLEIDGAVRTFDLKEVQLLLP